MKLEVLAVMFATLRGSYSASNSNPRHDPSTDTLAKPEIHVHEQLQSLEKVAEEYDGVTIKSVTNSVLVVFTEVSKAASAGLKMLDDSQQRGQQVSIAIHVGELAIVSGDVYGETVNIASRIASITEPSEIIISEAARELLKSHSFQLSAMGAYEFKGIFYPIGLFRLQRSLHSNSDRTSLFRRANSSTRILVGTWDVVLGVILMLAWSLAQQSGQILGTLQNAHHYPVEMFELQGTDIRSASRALWDHGSPWSPGKVVRFTPSFSARTAFRGASGNYDVFMGADMGQGRLNLTLGTHRQIIEPNWGYDGLGIKMIAERITLNPGDSIEIRRSDSSSNQAPEIDFIAFTPSGKEALRPHGIERSYRLYYLWKSIKYDDLNFHMFVLPIPCFTFLQMLLSMTILRRSMGCVLMGVYLRNSATREKPRIFAALLRLLAWCVYPLLAVQNLRSMKSPADRISGTELVIIIPSDTANN